MHTYISGGSKEPSPSADHNQKFYLFLTFFCFGNYLKNRWSFYVLEVISLSAAHEGVKRVCNEACLKVGIRSYTFGVAESLQIGGFRIGTAVLGSVLRYLVLRYSVCGMRNKC